MIKLEIFFKNSPIPTIYENVISIKENNERLKIVISPNEKITENSLYTETKTIMLNLSDIFYYQYTQKK